MASKGTRAATATKSPASRRTHVKIVPLRAERAEASAGEAEAGAPLSLDARIDGKVVEIRATERIEIRCGKACLVMTRDGKILINGTYVSTESSGAHRVRGGSVEIN